MEECLGNDSEMRKISSSIQISHVIFELDNISIDNDGWSTINKVITIVVIRPDRSTILPTYFARFEVADLGIWTKLYKIYSFKIHRPAFE